MSNPSPWWLGQEAAPRSDGHWRIRGERPQVRACRRLQLSAESLRRRTASRKANVLPASLGLKLPSPPHLVELEEFRSESNPSSYANWKDIGEVVSFELCRSLEAEPPKRQGEFLSAAILSHAAGGSGYGASHVLAQLLPSLSLLPPSLLRYLPTCFPPFFSSNYEKGVSDKSGRSFVISEFRMKGDRKSSFLRSIR